MRIPIQSKSDDIQTKALLGGLWRGGLWLCTVSKGKERYCRLLNISFQWKDTMSRSKYVKRGVKRKHSIIEDVLPLLENIAKIEGIKKVVPAKISYSPTRRISQPKIKFQRETISGFKLIAHGRCTIQEIFVAVDGSKKREVESKIKEELERIEITN